MLNREKKRAQSTLEYIVVLTAIVALIIYAAASWIRPAVTQSLRDANTAIGKAADRLVPPPVPPPGPPAG